MSSCVVRPYTKKKERIFEDPGRKVLHLYLSQSEAGLEDLKWCYIVRVFVSTDWDFGR